MSSFRPRYARRARAIVCAALVAACGDGAEQAQQKAAAQPDSASADTSALAVARRQIGPEVRSAIPFLVRNYDGRFIAAALPVQDWVDDPLRAGVSVAPGGHEIVILEMPDTSVTYAFTKPGLYVSDLPGTARGGADAPAEPDSNTLRQLSGVLDINGDGDGEVWAAQYGGPRHPYTWELRVYDRGDRALFQLAARRAAGGGRIDPASWEPSANLERVPAFRAWMTAKIEELESRLGGVDGAPAAAGGTSAVDTAAAADTTAADTAAGSAG
jgi:hypothetical protein